MALLLPLLLLCLVGMARSCVRPEEAYSLSGIVCRITYPAALVLNEKTTQVIQAAFQHARYPSMKGEKSLFFTGRVQYGLSNLEIHNLSIGQSEVELRANEGVGIAISNVSAVFKGTIEYGYGSWLFNLGQSVDFEIATNIDLTINPKLYCGKGKVAADTSDCSLTFHKLNLLLQGDREPGWLKRLFTDFVTFTVKLVIKAQICKEINNLANIMADFIQERAELFLSDGNIGMDVGVTSAPIITSNYIESYHKGLVRYSTLPSMINSSSFEPALLREERMLYFWISDQVLVPMVTAAQLDGRFACLISGEELSTLLQANLSTPVPAFLSKLYAGDPVLRVWSVSAPDLRTTPEGTRVRARAAVELTSGNDSALYFETEVDVTVRALYAEKNLILNTTALHARLTNSSVLPDAPQLEEAHIQYLEEAVLKIGVPKVVAYLEPGLTVLMNKQGLDLFDLIDPEVVPQTGYVVVQLDFGFPHHLLADFLKRTLE